MNRRHFLRNGLWVSGAMAFPAIVRAQGFVSGMPAKPLNSTGYTAYASTFDGTNDYLTKSSITGRADSKVGTLSAWVNFAGGDGTSQDFFSITYGQIEWRRNSSNKVSIVLYSTSAVPCVVATSTNNVISDSSWHHIIISFDTDVAGSCMVYVDGVDRSSVSTFTAGATVKWNQLYSGIGANTDGNYKLNGCMSEVFVDFATYYDISNSSTLQLFRTSAGKPADIPANIANASLANPIIYMKNPYDSFGTNSGTGGDFTVTGALDSCTSPSA